MFGIELYKANKDRDTFAKIFAGYNENFRKLEDYLKGFGSEIYIEHFKNCYSDILELEHPYRPNNNQIQVFLNGAVQWKNQGFEERQGGRSIRVPGLSPSDYVDVIIYQHFNFRSAEGYYMRTYSTLDSMLQDMSLSVNQSVAILTETRIMFFNIVPGDSGSPLVDENSVYLLENGNKSVLVQIAVTDVRDLPLASRNTPGVMQVGERLDIKERGLVSSTGEVADEFISSDELVKDILNKNFNDDEV